MKAAVFEEPRKITMKKYDVPEIGDYELLIRVAYCGICGTDVHVYQGKLPFVKYPIIPGHEFSGTIVKVGLKVENYSLGDKVAINPNLSCKDRRYIPEESCFYCKRDRPHFCKHWEAIGVTKPGAFAEYVTCPATSAFKIPDNISLKAGAMMEPLACCLHGLKKMNLSQGNTVLILGTGPIGLLMIALLKSLYNAEIIASDPWKYRRDMAGKLGAKFLVDPREESLQEIVTEKTDGHGVDIAVECVGSAKIMKSGLNLLNRGGRMLLFGVAPPVETININLFDYYNRELTVIGSFTNPHENMEALNLVQKRIIDPSRIISHEYSLEKLANGIKLIESGIQSQQEICKIVIKV
ncbi:MAG: zinc-dependent alcohol dehydrogenase family protein [Candidatus Hodarchaeales archaeon]|jgi:2-desacetyl-2-hydroxyethyl bacteriochlorophyllide A dehydrogenase